jgi:hypothetical protein
MAKGEEFGDFLLPEFQLSVAITSMLYNFQPGFGKVNFTVCPDP